MTVKPLIAQHRLHRNMGVPGNGHKNIMRRARGNSLCLVYLARYKTEKAHAVHDSRQEAHSALLSRSVLMHTEDNLRRLVPDALYP